MPAPHLISLAHGPFQSRWNGTNLGSCKHSRAIRAAQFNFDGGPSQAALWLWACKTLQADLITMTEVCTLTGEQKAEMHQWAGAYNYELCIHCPEIDTEPSSSGSQAPGIHPNSCIGVAVAWSRASLGDASSHYADQAGRLLALYFIINTPCASDPTTLEAADLDVYAVYGKAQFFFRH